MDRIPYQSSGLGDIGLSLNVRDGINYRLEEHFGTLNFVAGIVPVRDEFRIYRFGFLRYGFYVKWEAPVDIVWSCPLGLFTLMLGTITFVVGFQRHRFNAKWRVPMACLGTVINCRLKSFTLVRRQVPEETG